jgi:hypothetical protein
MDLLGYVWQKSGDEDYPYRESTLEAYGRNAQTLLLGRLPASLKPACRQAGKRSVKLWQDFFIQGGSKIIRFSENPEPLQWLLHDRNLLRLGSSKQLKALFGPGTTGVCVGHPAAVLPIRF